MAIELHDVILCVDAKTIDMCGNPGDDDSIHFQKNQITFNNKPKYGQLINQANWPGIEFTPYLKDYYLHKPCLTYFITVNYEDDGNSFKLSHVSFCCVPHKQIVNKGKLGIIGGLFGLIFALITGSLFLLIARKSK